MFSKWTGVPVSRMLEGEMDKLVHMEERIHHRVVGQDEAIGAVSNTIRRARAGLQDPNRPLGSFLFLGPDRRGQDRTVQGAGRISFRLGRSSVRIDMSEFMEKHSVARLIGAPPGYVGYEEGGQLTEAVRRKPYWVMLLDEVEKAHPDVFDVLLQVLDDGRMTDGQGRTVDFKNTVVVMTSNLGSQMIQQMSGDDYQVIKLAVMGEVKTHSAPNSSTASTKSSCSMRWTRRTSRASRKFSSGFWSKRLAGMEMPLEVAESALAEMAGGGLRSGIRRAPAEAGDPGAAREPAGQGNSRRPICRQGNDRGRSAGWPLHVREAGAG